MKTFGFIHKVTEAEAYLYFPALGSFGTMNFVNCCKNEIFEFDSVNQQLTNPRKCENLQSDYGKIVEITEKTLKIKLQNSINYTLPVHFLLKQKDELELNQEVKVFKSATGMIVYAELVENLKVEEINEDLYPTSISKKYPFRQMKNLFKFNEKVKKSLDTLQTTYSSYRKIRGDGNCYYRAIGFAYIEHLCRASCPDSKFIDFIHTSCSDLQPVLKYLFSIKSKFGSSTSYCEEIFSNDFNDLALIKDIKSRVVTHIQSNPEKFSPFLTHSLEQEIKNILEMGREAEGLPCSFMTEILGISIENVLVDREGVKQNKLNNENSDHCIYLCLRTGHYDLLYTYAHDCEDFGGAVDSKVNSDVVCNDAMKILLNHTKYLYEVLFKLAKDHDVRLSKLVPDTKDRISKFWLDFLKISEKNKKFQENIEKILGFVSESSFITEVFDLCAFCLKSNSDLKLFCGHLMCREDAKEILANSTNGLFLINDWEGSPPQCIICNSLMTEEDLKKILGNEFEGLDKRRRERKRKMEEEEDKSRGVMFCKGCNQKKKVTDFNQSHKCVCSECLPASIRNGACLYCEKKISLDYMKSLKLLCSLCELPLKSASISHQSHSICSNCDKQCLLSQKCLVCSKPLSTEETLSLSQKYFECCFICNKFFPPSTLSIRKCGCLSCDNCYSACLSQNSGCCLICSQRLGAAKSSCVICTDEFNRDEMLTLNCDHYFCSTCLKQHIENSIKSGQEKLTCPNCQEAIDGLIIQSLASGQLWDLYNKASIRKHFRLVDCPKCGTYFETEQNIARCVNCKFKFCFGCKEAAHSGNCDDQKIVKIIKELEDRGERVAQCPGCKIPYTKDEGCEHVACTNPKCGSEFCFTCSCHRSPTLVHGNHYHREDCKFYGKFDGPDEFSDKCERCKKVGKLCSRPKRLKVQRRFGDGEE